MVEAWTAPPVERRAPDQRGGERAALEQWLDYHRQTLLAKCAGLTAQQLVRRAVPPSTLSLLGLVRHLADVERWWFRMHAGGEDLPFRFSTEEDPEGDFDNLSADRAPADLAAYREELHAARAAVRGKDLDLVVESRGHHRERTMSVRWIYLHMIEEYARHNGHADLLREVIDGTTGE